VAIKERAGGYGRGEAETEGCEDKASAMTKEGLEHWVSVGEENNQAGKGGF
jgi:hypothetical protein